MAIYRRIPGVIVKQERSPLRTGRDHRRSHTRVSRAGRRFAQPMVTIHERGSDPDDRSDPGDLEGDLIVGPRNRSAIGTLVERNTRYLRLVHLEASTAVATYESLVRVLGRVPQGFEHGASEVPNLGSGQGDGQKLRDYGSDRAHKFISVTWLVPGCGEQTRTQTAYFASIFQS